eukprot:CAMPEP_0118838782 /NCGR_PEP_ID=MMETSP1162-20130426/67354_1 /TAXON_ID=33656 /ORGANISM="Phaeocystis Sp, Strain CCMP2710" /LENGTH=44 /DNA_ID= /DNA_START= /DNA_END= /DNA_ORIENTATION=
MARSGITGRSRFERSHRAGAHLRFVEVLAAVHPGGMLLRGAQGG